MISVFPTNPLAPFRYYTHIELHKQQVVAAVFLGLQQHNNIIYGSITTTRIPIDNLIIGQNTHRSSDTSESNLVIF